MASGLYECGHGHHRRHDGNKSKVESEYEDVCETENDPLSKATEKPEGDIGRFG